MEQLDGIVFNPQFGLVMYDEGFNFQCPNCKNAIYFKGLAIAGVTTNCFCANCQKNIVFTIFPNYDVKIGSGEK